MNDLIRASHDAEIERLHEKMSGMDPTTEEYGKIFKYYDVMIKSSNEDDKIQAEAKADELKIEADADKMRENADEQKRRNKLDLILGITSAATSIGVSCLAFFLNLEIQKRALLFEENGYALTTRSDKHLVPMPKHKI